jgi:hypothetical protein
MTLWGNVYSIHYFRARGHSFKSWLANFSYISEKYISQAEWLLDYEYNHDCGARIYQEYE